MGSKKGPYNEEFPVGIIVRIADRRELEAFMADWRGHHPLAIPQLSFAGAEASVRAVAFYHGADELYELEGIPGIWHERCLSKT